MHGWGLGLPFPCVFLLLTTMWSCHLYQYPISCCHHCIIRIFLLFSFRQKTTKANHACAYSKRNNERLRRCWWLRYGKIENQVQHEIGPQSYLLSPFQIIGRLLFWPWVWLLVLFKNLRKISLLLLWLALSIQRFSGVAWIREQRPEASWFVCGKEDLFFYYS